MKTRRNHMKMPSERGSRRSPHMKFRRFHMKTGSEGEIWPNCHMILGHFHMNREGNGVFTSLEIDDELFKAAWAVSPARTKKGLIEDVLRTYVRLHEQAGVRALRGQLVWKGDLDEMRDEMGGKRRAGTR
jgi:putative antitoxin of VapBC-like toxin-antitoxin system